jgi:hypothetical protein
MRRTCMKKLLSLSVTCLLIAGLSLAAPKEKTFTGEISDSMCGAKHMMGGSAKDCTEKCVSGGSKYVLADTASNKIYQLSDQEKPKAFSGEKVKVTGTLKGDTIEISSIEAAK